MNWNWWESSPPLLVPLLASLAAQTSSVEVYHDYVSIALMERRVRRDVVSLICVTKANTPPTIPPPPPTPPLPLSPLAPLTSDYCSAGGAFPCWARRRARQRRIPPSFSSRSPFANRLSPAPRFPLPIGVKRLPRVIRSLTVCFTSRRQRRAGLQPGLS